MEKKWMETKAGEDYVYRRATAINPILQIKMKVYNHEKYLAQAIESVLMQRTNYVYELVIEDDCSLDRSWEIISDYQQRFPEKISALHWNYNTFRLGYNPVLLSKYLTAKYISHLEGDDYWTDIYKIQKQISFLDKHPEIIGVAGNIRVVNEDGSKQHRDYRLYPYQDSHICGKEYIKNYQMIAHISAITFRNFFLDWDEERFTYFSLNKANGDDKICAILGLTGDVYYSSEIYGDHRRVFKGQSWTSYLNNKSLEEQSTILEELKTNLMEFTRVCYGEEIKYKKTHESEKEAYISRIMDMWIKAKQNNLAISELLRKKEITSVAIYGMSALGVRLFHELKSTETIVKYAIDIDKAVMIPNLKVLHSLDEIEEIPDVVIVTAFMTFDQIKQKLEEVGCSNVIGLDELIYEMCSEIQDENLICKMQ